MTKEPKKKRHCSWNGHARGVVRDYYDRFGKELSGAALRDFIAVDNAVEETLRMNDGQSRMKLISLLHRDRAYTLEGAADIVGCGPATASRWQKKFFEMVARNCGWID